MDVFSAHPRYRMGSPSSSHLPDRNATRDLNEYGLGALPVASVPAITYLSENVAHPTAVSIQWLNFCGLETAVILQQRHSRFLLTIQT